MGQQYNIGSLSILLLCFISLLNEHLFAKNFLIYLFRFNNFIIYYIKL